MGLVAYCCAVGPTTIHTHRPDGAKPEPPTAADLVLALRSMSRALQELLTAQARATGIPLLEFLILIRAADGDGVTPLEAGRALRLRSSTMTGLTDRLENDKLIRRTPHPRDRRQLLLEATPKGRKAVERTLRPLLAQFNELAGTLQGDQRAILGSFLVEVSALVLQQAEAARPRPTRRAVTRAAATR